MQEDIIRRAYNEKRRISERRRISIGSAVRYAALALASAVIVAASYVVARSDYPLFHSFADAITVFIAASVFLVVWNGRRMVDNHYFLFISISFLFFAFLDFMHLLGNKNMGVFPKYGNLGPTLYIVSRYELGLSFLVAPIFIKRRVNSGWLFVTYSVATMLVMLSIFYWKNFPVTYIESTGLTPFKVISDYVICVMLATGGALLWLNRGAFDRNVSRTIAYSILLSVATGLSFTLYTDPFGITNMVGHLFQIGSFLLVYFAFVDTALTRPQAILYRNLQQGKDETFRLNTELERANLALKQDIAERTRMEEGLKASEERFYKAFYASPAALAITKTSDGTIIEVNGNYEVLLGYTRQELIGRKTTDLNIYLTPEQRGQIIRRLRENGQVRNEELAFRRKDGQIIDTLCSLEVIKVGDEDLFLSMILDITERKKTEQLKDEFIGMVSHEIKTPLTVIIGALSTAATVGLSEEDARELMYDAITHADVLNNITDNLLELSRAQSNRLTLQKDVTDIAGVVNEVIDTLGRKSRQHRLMAGIAPGLSTVTVDRLRVVRILHNLVDNAIKYSPTGGEVKITVRQEPDRVLLGVTDQGIGITPEDQSRLFRRFERVGTRSHSSIQGIGLGLNVCRILVEAHGGKIWVESLPGKGSTFYFTIPVQAAAET